MSFVLTLDDVMSIYRGALGSQALLVNGFIYRLRSTKDGTAAIGKDGTLYYCPQFFEQHANTPGKVKDLIMHELMHPVLGDMNRDPGMLPNLAGDIVINAMLYNLKLADCEFQRDYYPVSDGPLCLLRSKANPPKELLGIYASMYPGEFTSTRKLDQLSMRCENPLEIMRALQVAYPEGIPPSGLLLMGSHDSSLPSETEDGEFIDPDEFSVPSEVVSDVADICEEISERLVAGGGFSHEGHKVLFNILKSKRRLKSQLLRGFNSLNVTNKLKQYFKGVAHSRSIVPTSLSKNEAAKISMGFPPLFFKRKVLSEHVLRKTGVAFYLDVSGSVYVYLPAILGIFENMKEEISSVYCFSNFVREIQKEDFLGGKIVTTGGTDFNCVIKHAVEKGHDKVLVFSDGGAGANEECKALARKHIKKMGIVYFGQFVRANWIDRQYNCSFELEKLLGD